MPPIPTARRRYLPSGRVGGVGQPLSTADTGQGIVAQGLAKFGTSLEKVGLQLKKVSDNRQVAQGITDYNNIINTYNESLPGRDPDDYISGFEALQPQIDAITSDMSPDAAEALQNRFAIWTEHNRAKTSILAMQSHASLAKQEIPLRLSEFASEGMDAEAEVYIENYGDILSPKERDAWKDTYEGYKIDNNIFALTTIASDNPSPENIKTAKDYINKNTRATARQTKDEAIYRNLQRLRTQTTNKTKIRDETFRAIKNKQSEDMAQSYLDNIPYDKEILPEMQVIKDSFDQRVASGSLDASDGITYNAIGRNVDEGKFFESDDLVSAFATGMSKEEYQDLVARNDKNKSLTLDQKGQLTKFNEYAKDRYAKLYRVAVPKLSVRATPEVLSAIDADTVVIRKMIRDSVLAGETSDEIYRKIEDAFITDTDRLYKGWFGRFFSFEGRDFTQEIRDIGDRQERYEVITDMIKSGREYDLDRIDDILKRWYE